MINTLQTRDAGDRGTEARNLGALHGRKPLDATRRGTGVPRLAGPIWIGMPG